LLDSLHGFFDFGALLTIFARKHKGSLGKGALMGLQQCFTGLVHRNLLALAALGFVDPDEAVVKIQMFPL